MTKYGVQLSSNSKTLFHDLDAYEDAGGVATQIFCSNPMAFARPTVAKKYDGGVIVVVHAPLVINLADSAKRTRDSARWQMEWCAGFGAQYLVFHSGSSKEAAHSDGIHNLVEIMLELSEMSDKVTVCLENAASGKPYGTKGSLGSMTTLQKILGQLPKAAVCLDTAHAWACGEDVPKFLGKLPIPVMHFNNPDKGVLFGSHRDRHSGSVFSGEVDFLAVAEIVAAFRPKVAIAEGADSLETMSRACVVVKSLRST